MPGFNLCGLERFLPRLGFKRTTAETPIPLSTQKGKASAGNASTSHVAPESVPPGSDAPATLGAGSRPEPSPPHFAQPTRAGTDAPVEAGKDQWVKSQFGPLQREDGDGKPVAFAHPTYNPGQTPENTGKEQRSNTILPADASGEKSMFGISESSRLPLVPGQPIMIGPHSDPASVYLNSSAKMGWNPHFKVNEEPRETRTMTHSQHQATKLHDAALEEWDPDKTKRTDRETGLVLQRTKDEEGNWKVRAGGPLIIGEKGGPDGWHIRYPQEQLEHPDTFATSHTHPMASPPSMGDQNNIRKVSLFAPEPGEQTISYNLVKKGGEGPWVSYDGRFRNDGQGNPGLDHIQLRPPSPEQDPTSINTPPPSPGAL